MVNQKSNKKSPPGKDSKTPGKSPKKSSAKNEKTPVKSKKTPEKDKKAQANSKKPQASPKKVQSSSKKQPTSSKPGKSSGGHHDKAKSPVGKHHKHDHKSPIGKKALKDNTPTKSPPKRKSDAKTDAPSPKRHHSGKAVEKHSDVFKCPDLHCNKLIRMNHMEDHIKKDHPKSLKYVKTAQDEVDLSVKARDGNGGVVWEYGNRMYAGMFRHEPTDDLNYYAWIYELTEDENVEHHAAKVVMNNPKREIVVEFQGPINSSKVEQDTIIQDTKKCMELNERQVLDPKNNAANDLKFKFALVNPGVLH